MDKILSFIINENKELLLLKGSENDPQFKKSFWYVVTGGCELEDNNKEDTVKREIKEETNLEALNMIYLNWIFIYKSLGKICTEYAYITFVKKEEIILNEESVNYKWCRLEDFINSINWFGDKVELKMVLEKAIKKKLYFKHEHIDNFLK